jgi:hypothetical protein
MVHAGSERSIGSVMVGMLTGFAVALVVSCGILTQRIVGTTTATTVAANAATTLAAVVAVLLTVRAYVVSLDPSRATVSKGEQRASEPFVLQAIGAVGAVILVHAFAAKSLGSHPWLREEPRQFVNDLVGVFGVLAFVWGCAQKPIRTQLMIGGLVLVLGYELTSGCWHLDALPPHDTAWSVQRFVGSEVTASGLGVLAFRLLLA